jgi:hypothetical protein
MNSCQLGLPEFSIPGSSTFSVALISCHRMLYRRPRSKGLGQIHRQWKDDDRILPEWRFLREANVPKKEYLRNSSLSVMQQKLRHLPLAAACRP